MHKSNVTIDPNSGYEKRDVSLSTIMRWVVFLFIFVVICAAIAFVTYVVFLPQGRDPLALETLTPGQQRPPSPVLQAYPRAEMRQFLLDENEAVNSYGWANKEQNEVRIPVDKAIEMLAARGLPTGQQPVSRTDINMRPGISRPPAEGKTAEPGAAPSGQQVPVTGESHNSGH